MQSKEQANWRRWWAKKIPTSNTPNHRSTKLHPLRRFFFLSRRGGERGLQGPIGLTVLSPERHRSKALTLRDKQQQQQLWESLDFKERACSCRGGGAGRSNCDCCLPLGRFTIRNGTAIAQLSLPQKDRGAHWLCTSVPPHSHRLCEPVEWKRERDSNLEPFRQREAISKLQKNIGNSQTTHIIKE